MFVCSLCYQATRLTNGLPEESQKNVTIQERQPTPHTRRPLSVLLAYPPFGTIRNPTQE
ncbi:hypothetical protein RP20_CCG013092 [Aedes albopictus]|nr:hypothetical protein RP20_CCG013092 [Aedes albopictus]